MLAKPPQNTKVEMYLGEIVVEKKRDQLGDFCYDRGGRARNTMFGSGG